MSDRRTVTRRFRGQDFTIAVSASTEILSVDIRQTGGLQWAGKFTARFIEEISQRTGSFKSFPVFIKMLLTALNGDSDSLTLDIMASEDLQLIRSGASPVASSDKRYLILTYSSDFDKIHYPLALSFISVINSATVSAANFSAASYVTPSGPIVVPSGSYVAASGPIGTCICNNGQKVIELQRQVSEVCSREIRSRTEFERLVDEFQSERDRLMDERGLNAAERAELTALRESNKWFESEIANFRDSRNKLIAKHKSQMDEMTHEVSALRHNERQLKLKLKQTEQDLLSAKSSSAARRPSPSRAPDSHRSPVNRSTLSNASSLGGRAYSRTPSPSRGNFATSPRRPEPRLTTSPRPPVSRAPPPPPPPSSGWGPSPRSTGRPDTATSGHRSPSNVSHRPPSSLDTGRVRSEIIHHHQPSPSPSAYGQQQPSSSDYSQRQQSQVATRAAVDIKDIDARLTALQNFLKQSKLAGL